MEFSDCVEFCELHNIKWMPANLKGKTPNPINHAFFSRIKKDGTPSKTPNYTEFITIKEADLFKRQKLLLTGKIYECIEDPKNTRIGIDTYEVFQIDIDTETINDDYKIFIEKLEAKTAYYKSISKSYGRHYFIRVENVEEFKKYIKEVKPEAKGIRLQFKNEGIELLCGQWGYIKPNTEFINKEKIMTIQNDDLIKMLVLPEKKINMPNNEIMNPDEETTNEKKTPLIEGALNKDIEITPEEVEEHMNNISIQYIDVRHHHFKIICSLLSAGYEEIALKCMFRSSNTKNKDLKKEFESFKKGNNHSVSLKTLLWYSKNSNEEEFNKIISRNRVFNGLHPSLKEEIFKLRITTEKLNERYLPVDLLDDIKDKTTIHIKSHLGTGKTTVIKSFLKKNKHFKVLYFAPRIAFARDIYNDLKDIDFCLYGEGYSNESDKVITQLESVWKFTKVNYDILIIDEIESVLKQLCSFNTNKKLSKTYEVFETLVKNTNILISADAFLSNSSIDTISRIRGDTTTRIIENIFNPYDRIALEVKGILNLCEKASMTVKNGKNIVFITTQKSMGDNIYSFFKEHNPDAKIAYYYGNMDEKTKREHFENVNEVWAKLNILIYTPVITCGVNFDPPTPHFHKLYMYITPYSCVIRDLFQSSLRVRKLIDNDCFYCYGYNKMGNTFSLERREFEAKNDTLHEIEDNLIKNYDILAEYKINPDKSPEWIIKNLAYKLYEEQLTNKKTVQITNEYFKLCGYEVLPQQFKYYKYSISEKNPEEINEDNFKDKTNIPDYDTIQEIDNFINDALQKQYDILEEKDKYILKKYNFNKLCFNIIQNKTDTTNLNELFNDYLHNPEIFKNWIYETYECRTDAETEEYKKNILLDIKENKELSHALQNLNYTKYELIKKTVGLLYGTKDMYGVIKKMKNPFPIVDYVNNNTEIFNKHITEIKSIFGLRDIRGENLGKYYVSCFKAIMADYYGITFKSTRISVEGKKIHALFCEHPKLNLFEKYMGLYPVYKNIEN